MAILSLHNKLSIFFKNVAQLIAHTMTFFLNVALYIAFAKELGPRKVTIIAHDKLDQFHGAA